jgi:hypothetical protein
MKTRKGWSLETGRYWEVEFDFFIGWLFAYYPDDKSYFFRGNAHDCQIGPFYISWFV